MHLINKLKNTSLMAKALMMLAFIFTVVLMSFILAVPNSENTKDEPKQRFAHISGLSEKDKVSYTIESKSEILHREVVDMDKAGDFKVPLFSSKQDDQAEYKFDIQKGEKRITLNMRQPSGQRALEISGKGPGSFSDIKIGTKQNNFETKADWSGNFQINPSQISDDLKNLESFRLALYGMDGIGNTVSERPLIVDVLQTGGGGGYTSEGVNQFADPIGCGNPDMSICDNGEVGSRVKEASEKYVTSMMEMTQQLSVFMMKYVSIIGTFFDAEIQLQTQRQLQSMRAQAHKDYHPSEQMCVFGSFVKSVATAEEKARFERNAFNQAMMGRYTNATLPEGFEDTETEVIARLDQFKSTYCNPKDNNNALAGLCTYEDQNGEMKQGGQDPKRWNRDLDYVSLADTPLTLDIDFSDEVLSNDEEDIIALARNLYWPQIFNVQKEVDIAINPEKYYDARRIMAMYNASHNTLSHIMAMKAKSPQGLGAQSGWSFMKAFMRDFDLQDSEINKILGDRPSYYAQMEVLTKKLYQSPSFYTNLYDKPTNVNRISAALDAIKLMQMRDWFQTKMRQEMLASLLLEEEIVKKANDQKEKTATISIR